MPMSVVPGSLSDLPYVYGFPTSTKGSVHPYMMAARENEVEKSEAR